MQKYGFEVSAFSNGNEVINNFEKIKDKFDIILSDIVMPGMNGIELYDRLKKIKPDIKFIFMTGYANDIDMVKELMNDGVPVLSKPFKIEEFLNKIKELEK